MRNNDAALHVMRNRGQSALIVLALALSMGCMLAMASVGAGGEAQFGQSVSSGDPLQIIVSPGAGTASINEAAIKSLQSVAGVQGATGVIELPLQIALGGYKAGDITVTAVDPMALRGRLSFASGGLFTAQSASPQIVLGYGAQMKFSNAHAPGPTSAPSQNSSAEPTPPPLALGQSAQVSFAEPEQGGKADGENTASTQGRVYSASIAGVLKQDKSNRNGQAFMSLASAQKMLRENFEEAQSLGLSADSYAQAYVFAKDVGSVKAVEDAIAALGYTAQSDVADLDGLLLAQSLQRTVLAVIEAFCASTGVLLLLCILLAGSRKERVTLSALPGYAALGFIGGLAAVLLAGFFALIINTSSAPTVLFGLSFGQNSNITIPFGISLVTVAGSAAAAVLAAWAAHRRAV